MTRFQSVEGNNLDWKFTHEPFNALENSNEFQERYVPNVVRIKKEEEEEVKVKPSKRAITVAGKHSLFEPNWSLKSICLF